MIKRKVKAKIKKVLRRKNPKLESEAKNILSQFGKNIKFEYLNKGSYAEVYYFAVNNSKKLKPGEYVLKIFNYPEYWLSDEKIKYLIKLSNYGLIPKIYYLDENFIIMKYIQGKSLKSLIDVNYKGHITSKILDNIELNIILLKVVKLINNWHRLNLIHGDIHEGNILLSDSGKIYLIDPNLEIEYLSKQKDVRFFRDIYHGVNPDESKLQIEERMKELFND